MTKKIDYQAIRDFFTDNEWDVIDAALNEYQDNFSHLDDETVTRDFDNVGMKLQSIFDNTLVDDTKYVNKNITPMDFLIKKTGKTARWIKNDFFNYTLNECKPRITFEKITADSGKYKGPELYAARLVYLFNNM